MKTCVVCGMQLPDEAMVCNRCGFPMHQRAFLSEAHYRAWMREVIEPCRIDWHRRDIEQQRKQLKEQKRQIEEQRRKLEEQQKSKKEPERPVQNRRTEWNTADSGWNQTAKEQKPKKKGGMVKNALIALVVFAASGLIGRAVIAPSSSPSSASSGGTQPHINVDLGIWSATYFYEEFWHFEVYAGNAKKYYETVCEKFKDAGFEQGKETKQDNRRSIYYTLSGKWSIQVEYNPIYHHIELYCNLL